MEQKTKNMKDFFNILRKMVLYFSTFLMIASAVVLLKQEIIDPAWSDKNNKEINKVSNISSTEHKINFDELIKINPDIKGWIKIDGTIIDYPVLQSSESDSVFYLDKNYKKEKDKNGSIFINSCCSPFNDEIQNTVMHGHSMKNGRMFSALLKYSNLDYLKSHYLVDFDTIYETGKWKIFAVIKTNSKSEDGEVFDYFTPNFNSQRDFFEFVYKIKIRSIINIPVNISESDKIISLSTCSYEMDGFRTVVFARKIRQDEDINIDFDNLKMNKNPLMPEGWYRKRKKNIPKFLSFDEALKQNKIDWITTQ